MSIVRLQGGGLRYLDAPGPRVVTRPLHDVDDGQHWLVTDAGDGLATIQQISSGLFLTASNDGDLVVVSERTARHRWRIEDFGGGFASIEHVETGRYLQATIGGDFAVVMRSEAHQEQTWRIGDVRHVGGSN
jgi:hypothetical protein